MFNIPNYVRIGHPDWLPDVSHLPEVIEGEEIYDTLCPVSKETCLRENALSLLTKVLDPRNASLLDAVLQEIPKIQENQNISDDDALDMLVSRFDQGTMYENQELRERLSRSLDVLLPKRSVEEKTIEFKQSDFPSPSPEV